MVSKLRSHFGHNVVGYLALFFALTGVAYAAGPLKAGDPAGGDLTGIYPNPTIKPCSATQILKFDGTNWACAADNSGGGVATDVQCATTCVEDSEVADNITLASGTVGDTQIKPTSNISLLGQSINSAEIIDDSITSADIANGTITSADMSPNAVGSTEIIDNSITSADIANGTITSADIASLGSLTFTPSTSAPVACSSSTRGVVYYDSDFAGSSALDEGLASCNGTAFTSVADGSTLAD
jgi:hypothetical protein